MKSYTVVIASGDNNIKFTMAAEDVPVFHQVADMVINTPAISSQLGGAGLHSFSVVSIEEQ